MWLKIGIIEIYWLTMQPDGENAEIVKHLEIIGYLAFYTTINLNHSGVVWLRTIVLSAMYMKTDEKNYQITT
jgi:hypothetical protein